MKETIKRTLYNGRRIYHQIESDMFMRGLIKSAEEEIPPLTSSEKREIRDFWAKYGIYLKSLAAHRFIYAKTGVHDPRFVPPAIYFNRIIPRLNRSELGKAWDDKAFLRRRLQGLPCTKQIFANVNGFFYNDNYDLITAEEADKLLSNYAEVIVKPTIESGVGVAVERFSTPVSVRKLTELYKYDFSVQEVIRQSPVTAAFNPSSVNCVRVNSFMGKDGVHILSSFVHIGASGEIADNHGKQWYLIAAGGCKSDRALYDTGFDASYRKVSETASGLKFHGLVVPNYDKIENLAKQAHQRYPYFKLIGWDICLDEQNSPLIIEANLRYPGVLYPQMVCGPFFGDLTESILEEVKNTK